MLLNYAGPVRFENGVLTLEFNQSAQKQMEMCKSNGRAGQIEAVLSEYCSQPVKLKFMVAAEKQAQTDSGPVKIGTSSQKRNELMNDPAVKTILLGMDATITNIEED